MALLKKLASIFTPEGERDAYTHWVYVQCDRCGEKLCTRIDLRNDLSVQYGATDRDITYFCRKALVGGGRCFQQIEVELTFDAHRQLVEQRVRGGKFVGEGEKFDRVIE